MKILGLLLLAFLSNTSIAEFITAKEAFGLEEGPYWHIKKEVSVTENQSITILMEFTSRGSGSIKLSHGKWMRIYDCSTNGGFIFDPCMLKQEIKDLNGDGFKDLRLSTKLIVPGEKESDPNRIIGDVFANLIFDSNDQEFKLGKHSPQLKTYKYYE